MVEQSSIQLIFVKWFINNNLKYEWLVYEIIKWKYVDHNGISLTIRIHPLYITISCSKEVLIKQASET